MLVVGLVLGRVWAIPLGAVGWAGVLLVSATISPVDVPVAAALAAANVAVGVLGRRVVARRLS
jgi:hypothetical protein